MQTTFWKRFGLVGAVTFAAALGAGLAGAQTVTRQADDSTTKGAWDTKYGSLYAVVPQNPNTTREPENFVGPLFYKGSVAAESPSANGPRLYTVKVDGQDPTVAGEDAQCISGSMTADVDFRVYTKFSSSSSPIPNDAAFLLNTTADGQSPAFLWHYCEAGLGCGRPSWNVNAGIAQVNKCTPKWGRSERYNGVWDSANSSFEPLVLTLRIAKGGDYTLAYYFLEGEGEGRAQAFDLRINGVSKSTGTIGDFSGGKFLVFSMNLPEVAIGGSPYDVQIVLTALAGPNSSLGGAFLSGKPTTVDTCKVCSGNLTSLKLKWVGDKTSLITVKRDGGAVLFSESVNPQGEFIVADPKGLGSDLYFYVNNYKVAVIKGDCSQQVGPGLEFNAFRVVSGTSSAGTLCAVKTCDPPAPKPCKVKHTHDHDCTPSIPAPPAPCKLRHVHDRKCTPSVPTPAPTPCRLTHVHTHDCTPHIPAPTPVPCKVRHAHTHACTPSIPAPKVCELRHVHTPWCKR